MMAPQLIAQVAEAAPGSVDAPVGAIVIGKGAIPASRQPPPCAKVFGASCQLCALSVHVLQAQSLSPLSASP